eukprot:tig00001206_g7501.t1
MQEAGPSATRKKLPKQRVLLVSSRGLLHRHRHLLEDLQRLLPHSKKDAKLDSKDQLSVLNEICDLKGCNTVMYFEARKKADLYLWLARSPQGPSAKFQVLNIHTMDELKLTGNCLLGSRPVLVFDANFDSAPNWQLLKEMFSQTFATPRQHKKSKPFIDHVLSFSIVDNHIWFRNYQISLGDEKDKKAEPTLVEIGPRLVLNPIVVISGSFGGPVLWHNPHFVSPNEIRAAMKRQKGSKFENRDKSAKRRAERLGQMAAEEEPEDDAFAE